jgi:murein DD-endopeptidase MepM/ murein hydrolase activator NlpD
MLTPSPVALQRIRAEGKVIRDARATFTPVEHFAGGFIWPARWRISGAYGGQRILNGKPRRPHLRIDIAAPTGAQVVAAAPGRVTLANRDMYFTGGTVIIDHGHGLSTVYSHLSAIDTKVGQMVKQGEGIGKVGSTGRSTGPHLDWRVNWFQERLDPSLLVGPMRK